jgi:hypothetical protein
MGVIYRVTAVDKPLFDMLRDGEAHSKFHTWMTDALTVRQDNAQVEGADIVVAAPNTPSVVGNWTQIFQKTWRVSESHEAMSHAGIASLVAHQMKLRLVECLTDMETAFWKGSLATGTSGAASRLTGVIATLSTHKTTVASGTSSVLDETLLNDFYQMIWTNIQQIPTELFVGGTLKRRISGFTTGITRNEVASSGELNKTISVYYGDFGRIQVHLCRDIPSSAPAQGAAGLGMVAINPDFFTKAWLRSMKTETLPKLADSYDGRIVGETTLQTGNEAASGAYLGLS